MTKPRLIPLECSTTTEYGPWWHYQKAEAVAVRRRDIRGVVDQLMCINKHDIIYLGSGSNPKYLRIKGGPLSKHPPVVVMPRKQYEDLVS